MIGMMKMGIINLNLCRLTCLFELLIFVCITSPFTYICIFLMKETIALTSWNMNSTWRSALPYLKHLASFSDMIVISEHALYECELWKIGQIDSNFDYIGKCSRNLKKL